MGKDRRTVSLDPEVEEFLSSEGVNASQLVNKLVRNHASAGGDRVAMLELREEQLQSEVNELERRLESKTDELETVRERLSDERSGRDQAVEDAAEELEGVPLDTDNPAIENWSEKLDLSPGELVDRLSEYREGE